jgi:carboxymethylenebutenolidase
MAYEGLIAESIMVRGHNGDEIEAYYARPMGPGPYGGIIVLHHGPGWDEWSHEVVRKFAAHGYIAIGPHLNSRFGPGEWDDVAARARAGGGNSDTQVIGDAKGCLEFLRLLPISNGKVGTIGFCSGGRQSYMAACNLPVDAAVDCWGGSVIVDDPSQLTPQRPVAVIDMTPNLAGPLLGLFGNEDANPDPDQVNRTEEVLKQLGKTYEFHRYDCAGHGFFNVAGQGYRFEQAQDGWRKVFAFYEKHLSTPVAAMATR